MRRYVIAAVAIDDFSGTFIAVSTFKVRDRGKLVTENSDV